MLVIILYEPCFLLPVACDVGDPPPPGDTRFETTQSHNQIPTDLNAHILAHPFTFMVLRDMTRAHRGTLGIVY